MPKKVQKDPDAVKKAIAETAFSLFRYGKTVQGVTAYDISQDDAMILHLRVETADPPRDLRYFTILVRED